MIQTKEEMFLAELGINPKEEIEGLYGAKIKIIDLVKKYQAEQLNLPDVVKSFTADEVADMLVNKFTTIEEAIHFFDMKSK